MFSCCRNADAAVAMPEGAFPAATDKELKQAAAAGAAATADQTHSTEYADGSSSHAHEDTDSGLATVVTDNTTTLSSPAKKQQQQQQQQQLEAEAILPAIQESSSVDVADVDVATNLSALVEDEDEVYEDMQQSPRARESERQLLLSVQKKMKEEEEVEGGPNWEEDSMNAASDGHSPPGSPPRLLGSRATPPKSPQREIMQATTPDRKDASAAPVTPESTKHHYDFHMDNNNNNSNKCASEGRISRSVVRISSNDNEKRERHSLSPPHQERRKLTEYDDFLTMLKQKKRDLESRVAKSLQDVNAEEEEVITTVGAGVVEKEGDEEESVLADLKTPTKGRRSTGFHVTAATLVLPSPAATTHSASARPPPTIAKPLPLTQGYKDCSHLPAHDVHAYDKWYRNGLLNWRPAHNDQEISQCKPRSSPGESLPSPRRLVVGQQSKPQSASPGELTPPPSPKHDVPLSEAPQQRCQQEQSDQESLDEEEEERLARWSKRASRARRAPIISIFGSPQETLSSTPPKHILAAAAESPVSLFGSPSAPKYKKTPYTPSSPESTSTTSSSEVLSSSSSHVGKSKPWQQDLYCATPSSTSRASPSSDIKKSARPHDNIGSNTLFPPSPATTALKAPPPSSGAESNAAPPSPDGSVASRVKFYQEYVSAFKVYKDDRSATAKSRQQVALRELENSKE